MARIWNSCECYYALLHLKYRKLTPIFLFLENIQLVQIKRVTYLVYNSLINSFVNFGLFILQSHKFLDVLVVIQSILRKDLWHKML